MRRTTPTFSLSTAAVLFGALLSAPLLTACDDEEEQEIEGEEKEEEGPPVQVSLPPSPDFDEGKAPEQWEDGAWSIWGLRRDIDKHVTEGDNGTEVEVKGWVQEIYVPPECPEGEVCPMPKQPHFWITDQEGVEGKKRAMMVVNYRMKIAEWELEQWKGQPEVIIEKGKRYTFKGLFKQFSDTGFAMDNGLLEFKFYKPEPKTPDELKAIYEEMGLPYTLPKDFVMPEWVAPPGAAWHPHAIALQDQQNAELAAQAAKSATEQ